MRLFVKTYEKDFQWLKVAMVAARKRCNENILWTIVVDDGTKDRFKVVLEQVQQHTPSRSLNVSLFETSEHWKDSLSIQSGYLRQQWIKMTAHRVMGSGYFWNWDSDVVAIKDFSIEEFCHHNKPIYWITQFNALMNGPDNAAHEMRKQMLRDIFGVPDISFEYMRCMPMPMMSEVLQYGEKSSYWGKVLNMCINGDNRVSEFNILGMYSHLYFLDVYEWRNTQNYERTFGHIVTQYWSHGGCPENVYKEIMNG